MDDLDELLAQVAPRTVRFTALEEDPTTSGTASLLFDAVQLPIVAFAILAALSLPGRMRLNVSEVGLRVGSILMDAFPQFAVVGRRLQWSLRVRSTSADAISFLEGAGLIEVRDSAATRILFLMEHGRTFVRRARRDEPDAAELLESLRASAMKTRYDELRLL